MRGTRRAMVVEQLLRAFWPLASLIALIAAAIAFGAIEGLTALPPQARRAVIWGAGALVAAALIGGLIRLRPVRRSSVEARLDATLPGRPLAGLRDHAALGTDGFGEALWLAHRQRLRAVADQARPVAASPDLPRRDPFALRLVALTALAMAVIFGQPARLLDLASLMRGGPQAPPAATAAASWEGWATPPAYTGKPAVYLNRLEGTGLDLPEGSRIALRFYDPAATALTQTIGTLVATTDPMQAEIVAQTSGRVEIGGPTGAAFDFTVLPDYPPGVAAQGVAERRADGRFVQGFAADDDHGVTKGQATITLDLAAVDRRHGLAGDPDPLEPLVYDLPLPAARLRSGFSATLTEDAAQHPLANLPVTLTLTVTDGLGQTGQSELVALVLPGRRFFDPLAAAVIEQRRDLLWSRANGLRVAQVLRAITAQPEGFLRDQTVYLSLRSVIRRVEADLASGALTEATRDEVAALLWDAAIQLEDGGLSDALDRMQRAQQRLSEAIRQGASPDEIQSLMDDLRRATDDYTRMLAERNDSPDPAERFARQPQSQPITGEQIQQMMDEIQRLMTEGKMAEAQALLEQFNRMMENLRITQGEGSEGQPGAMGDLSDTLRRQQELADEAFRQMQDGFIPQDGSPQDGPDAGQLADRQRDLRRDLGQQRGMLPGRGTPGGDAARDRLDDAGRAMDEAEQALRDGDPANAMDRQAAAIEALREGMRNLNEALMAQPAPGERLPADGQGTPQPQGTQRDPLGRAIGDGGPITSPDSMLDGETQTGRARRLMDEIRRRAGEQSRPEDERSYLRRLLDQF